MTTSTQETVGRPAIPPSARLIGSGSCWDCGKVLTEQNRTNRDNVLGHQICDNCHDDRWEDFMWDNPPND